MKDQENNKVKVGGMNEREMIMLVMLYSNKVISPNQLTDIQKEHMEALINRGTARVDEDGNYRCSSNGDFVTTIFKSGVSFDVLLSRLSNRHITLLQDKLIDIAYKRNIHLNVVFQNLTEEEWNKLLEEITEADKVREERAESVTDMIPQSE